MKTLSNIVFTSCLLLLLGSCSSDNYDLTTDEELGTGPIVVEVENLVSYRVADSPQSNASAVAYKNPATLPNSATYIVASETVDVVCKEVGGFSTSFAGSDFFQFMFYSDNTSTYVILGDFSTEIDGETITASTSIVPPNCQGEGLSVEFTETADRLRGTFTGEFYKLSDNLVSPFDSCVNYVSLGILTAAFDVELIDCN